MATNPNIILATQPVQVAGPLDQYKQVMALKAAQQQNALGAAQLQEAQLQQQGQQMALDQQKAINAAYSAAVKPNADGTADIDTQQLTNALASSGHGSAIPSILSGIAKYQKDLTDNKQAVVKLRQAQADMAGSVGATLKQANYDPHLFLTLATHAVADKAVNPEAIAPAVKQVQAALQQDPTGNTARQLVQQVSDQWIAASPEQQKIGNERMSAQARANQAETAAEREKREAQQQAVTNQRNTQNDQFNQQARMAELGIQQRNANINAGRLNVEQRREAQDETYTPPGSGKLTGDDFLKTLSPGQANLVKSIANGDIKGPTAGSRSPIAQSLRAAVQQYDPSFSDARYAAKQDFKTGKDSQNVVSLATALEHLERATDNSKGAGYEFLPSGAKAKYQTDVKLFTQEAGKLIKNGILAEGEYKDLKSDLDSRIPSVRDAALSELTNLMSGKVRGIFQKYKTATGQDLPVGQFFDKQTQQRLSKFGVIGNQQAPATSGQATPSIQDLRKKYNY